MPTNLPNRAIPRWAAALLPAVIFAATIRDETIAHTLIWRYGLANVIEAAGLEVCLAGLRLAPARAGLWLIRLATAMVKAATSVRPDRNGPFMRRVLGPKG